MTGTTNDQNATFTYNPASQIGGVTRANDLYAWTGHGSGSTASAVNGLNQLTSIGGAATAHDARGNLTTDPTSGKTYSYSSENLLTGASGGVTLGYDPATRLYQIAGASTTRFGYDGLDMILEANASNAIQRRFVHGPGVDQPLVQYEGPSTTDRRWLHADERGSVIAVSDGGGNVTTINRYDEFGKPQSTNAGRFQYTGQAWLPEIGAYYYKARMYGPALGQFLQTDPIGTDGGVNLYVYVGNDPVNALDPLGLGPPCPGGEDPITVCGMRLGALSFAGGASGGGGTGGGGGAQVPGSTSLPPTVDQGSYPNSHNDPPAPVDTIVVEAPRIRKLLSIGRLILSRAGLIITYLQLSGDSCTVCSNVEFPTDKSNLGHIFSGKSGHFSKDTPNNRKAIKSTVSQKYFIGRKVGVDVYRQTLPNGSQVWVEVYNGTVSNAGINSIPIYGF